MYTAFIFAVVATLRFEIEFCKVIVVVENRNRSVKSVLTDDKTRFGKVDTVPIRVE